MSITRVPPDHPESDDDFLARLRAMLMQMLGDGIESFLDLAASMRGAWPIETLTVLRNLLEDGSISSLQFERLMLPAPSKKYNLPSAWDALPQPHPLHYDWRFSPPTVQYFLTLIGHDKDAPIALLGVPSLYRPLRQLGRPVWLYDINAGLAIGMTAEESACFVCGDLAHPAEERKTFNFAIADPPWYLEHYTSFFEQMQNLLSPGGRALVSMLPPMTRPSATKDRTEILARAEALGFDLEQVFEDCLSYDTPPFEAAALSHENLILPTWRKADLYIFKKSLRRPQRDERWPRPANAEPLWSLYTFKDCSIAVRQEENLRGEFTFRSCSNTGATILQSVSRRSEARLNANLWSSQNHALILSRTDCVGELLRRFSEKMNIDSILNAICTTYALDHKSRSELKRLLDVLKECL